MYPTEIHCFGVHTVFFTADGNQVLSGGDDGMIRRWNGSYEAGQAIGAGNVINAVALSMDRKWLVCGLNSPPYAMVWNAKTRTNVLNIHGHAGQVQSVDISPNSTTFATGGSDACAFIWGFSTDKQLVGPLRHASTVVAVRFSPDGARLATASVGGSIRIFNSSNGQQLLDIPCSFIHGVSSPLAWSADGHQIFAISGSSHGPRCFNTTSGFLVGTWAPGNSLPYSCIALSSNQKFIAISGDRSVSFWDTSTHLQVGDVIRLASEVRFMALSPDGNSVVTSERDKITIWSLRDILPDLYLARHPQLPLIKTSDATSEAWTQGNLSRVEQILTRETVSNSSTPSRHAQVFAQRSLVRSRLKQHSLAIDDATKSVEIQRSAIGQIAIAIAHARNGDHDIAMRMFDLVFTNNDISRDINLILLIKAIVLFECGRHDEAISRVEDLINIVKDKTIYVTVRAQMHLLLAGMSLQEGDHERAAELLGRAGDVVIPDRCPELVLISFMFGWKFEGLAFTIEQHLRQCMKALEDIGDVTMNSGKAEEAISSYTAALSLNSSNRASLLVKRSRAWAMQNSWEDALKDADEAIKSDPLDPWGYERRHAALHALQRYDEAIGTLNHMVSLTENPLADSSAQCKCHGGGGDAALAHLLEDIVARLGEAAVLAWTGRSSSYNSCLPGTLAIHNQAPYPFPTIDNAEMDVRVAELKGSMSPADVMVIYDRVIRSPSTRFALRRLYLPCILFPVKKLVEKGSEIDGEKCYRARVSGIGHVEFRTADRLSEPRSLAFAHPWIRDLRGPPEEEPCGSSSDSEDDSLSWSGSDVEEESLSPAVASNAAVNVAVPLYTGPIATMEDGSLGDGVSISTWALRLVARLQQPFRGLLLQQQLHGGYKRVAAEHEIVMPGLERRISSAKEIRVEIVEIL